MKTIALFTSVVAVILIGFFLCVPVHARAASFASAPGAGAPQQLFIPSIKLNAAVQGVGIELNGAMSVPIAHNTVGWYAPGVAPGQPGSAVFDAHVYLAFKNLKNVPVGGSIYVMTAEGTWLHFVVSKIKSYAYRDVPLTSLFALTDHRFLNLITCAGKWLPGQATYDHRLVVYAELVG